MTKTRTLLQITVVLSLALGAGACSTLADLDPTGLLGGDSTPAPAGQFPDSNAPQASDAAIGTTPDLAALPSRPVTSSPAQQRQQAQSLAADGAQVQYSAEALRGGTEAAAPVPGAPPPPSALALAAPPPVSAPPTAENDAPPTTEAAPPPSAAQAPALAPAPAPSPRAPASQAAVAPAAAPIATGRTASAPTAAASAALPPGAQPAVPAVPANTPVRRGATALAAAAPSDAELGFQPSQAPALDPSISQWVPAPIVARYRQTASTAAIAPSTSSAAAVPPRGASDATGAVVANLGAIPGGSSAAVAPGGVTPTAVIYFPGDGTKLSAAARNELRAAVKAFKASGGTGTIRVVGHSSSRTANMPIEKHLETIFAKSQERADAVAQELIHQGVPADKVLVEAVGDSQPIYYESMPKGEDGNRRAEVFVQT